MIIDECKDANKNMKLSIIIPCFNSEKSIGFVIDELKSGLADIIEYEIVLVNDYSRDQTWQIISDLANSHDDIKAINLAKNCGQHSAILAGMRYATGDYVAVIDDDGQTPCSFIPKMLGLIDEGWDVVCGKFEDRGRKSFFRAMGSYMARRMSKWLLKEPEDVEVTIFFVARKYVIDEIIRYDQPYPYICGLLIRTTSRITNITVDQRERKFGQSGYSFKKLLGLWLNGFTAFSIKPLQITSYIGVISAIIGFLISIITVVRKLLGFDIALGWSSMMTVILVIGGCILVELGLLGEYVGRMYLSINRTPQSIIKETAGIEIDE